MNMSYYEAASCGVSKSWFKLFQDLLH